MKLRDILESNTLAMGKQWMHKKRGEIDESTVSIDDLDIKTHGKRNTLHAPTDRDVTLGFYDNKIGQVDLQNWKDYMKKKYGIKKVEVKDGTVIVKSPKLDKARNKYVQGKSGMLKKWGTTE